MQFTIDKSKSKKGAPVSKESVDHLCYLCLVFFILMRLFIAALWSPAGKGLTSWRLFVMLNCVFVTFPCGILGQVWYLIVYIPDLCHLYCLIKRKSVGFI